MFRTFQRYILTTSHSKRVTSYFFYLLAFSIFFIISYLLYHPLYQQLFFPPVKDKLVLQGEYPIYEFIAETVRLNILSFSNPFTMTTQVLYPFGWRYAFDDVAPINGFYFLFLRPFFSVHQSFILIVLISIFMNGISMYFLLRTLKLKSIIAFVVSIIFAYTPFVSLRLPAHPTYVALYVFPLSAAFFLKLILTSEKEKKYKYVWSLALGLSFVLFILTNLYFTVMCGVLIILIALFSYSKNLKDIMLKNFYYFGISLITFLLLLIPWLIEIYRIVLLRPIDKPKNIYDMVAFSADLVTILIPSSLNPFYRSVVNLLGAKYTYIQNIFENFTYPGALLLYGIVAYIIFRKKLPEFLKPIIYTLTAFFILTLGPYLQIFGINTHIPLPYLLIANLPLLQMARSPGRFIVPFIFLSSIILAYVLQYILKNQSIKKQTIFISFIACIFLIDQHIQMQQAPMIQLPLKLYRYINQQSNAPLLEIPFSIRDSVKNFGHYHTHWSSYATLLHHQPIFGVYAGRVPNNIYLYYLKNPLLRPLGNMIDINEENGSEIINAIQYEQMTMALDIYGVKYTILKEDEPFSKEIAQVLEKLNFIKRENELRYSLWERKIKPVKIETISFDKTYPEILIGEGWSPKEKGDTSRWMMDKTSRIFLITKDSRFHRLVVRGQSIVTQQRLYVYVNGIYEGTMTFSAEESTTTKLNLKTNLKNGLNVITFYASRTNKPADYIANSIDKRPLSLHVSYIGLQ